MHVLVDDIGSFPLPPQISREAFDKAYVLAREAIASGKDPVKDQLLFNNFHKVVIDSFKKKCETGIDIANYPQHYDMRKQYTDVIHKAMNEGTYVVNEKDAIIPEVCVINGEARRISEEIGKKAPLRVCVTGPFELYLKEIGTTAYKEILMMFAETVKRFARNSILNSKYVKTEVVSIDEPSFGFQDAFTDSDVILDVLERAFDFNGAIRQIHLHSPSKATEILNVKNLDVLSFEYAASPANIESVTEKMLENADKHIRVGVSRTDINSIMAELYEKGITKPVAEQLVENEQTIRKRFLVARERYGDRLAFAGPDCALGGWPTQEAALLLLRRTAGAVKSVTV
jgi:5-methyltetrahydropteroyltriglutamate--homocysteine methyltransferase